MFNEKSFRKEVTPKRVFALLKLVGYKNSSYTKSDLLNFIQPMSISSSQDEIKKVIAFCEKENLIKENHDGKYNLLIDEKYIENEKEFRKYINSILFIGINKNPFYEVTVEMLTKDMNLYDYTGFENIASNLKTSEADKETMLGWRFWATFLGYGFILNKQFVMNPYIRIQDIIEMNLEDKFGKDLSIREFITEITTYCIEMKNSVVDNELSISISLALSTLEGIGYIELKDVKDTSDRWKLNLGESIRYVTHIFISGVKQIG